MATVETISASYARSRVKNSHPARTGDAEAGAASYASHLRERSSRFANMDFNERQSRITAQLSRIQLSQIRFVIRFGRVRICAWK